MDIYDAKFSDRRIIEVVMTMGKYVTSVRNFDWQAALGNDRCLEHIMPVMPVMPGSVIMDSFFLSKGPKL